MEYNCDHCKYYSWYYDKCEKFDCKVDFREVHNCFEPCEIIIKNFYIKKGK